MQYNRDVIRLASSALGITPTMESEVEERKESWQENGIQALAALSNTRGGVLWIGVKDNGEPVEPNGWSDAGVAGRMEAISNQIVSKLGLHPSSMTVEELRGKPVLAIVVAKSPSPVSLDGKYWRRVGNTTRQVPAEELNRFLLERTGGHWDEVPCAFGMESLDVDAIEAFKVASANRLPALRNSDSCETLLRNLQLVDVEGRLLRGAVMLFGKDREAQRLSATAFIQVGRFRGSGATIVDDKTVQGNLFAQLDGAMAALRNLLHVEYEIPNRADGVSGIDSAKRKETWEYPLSALREAVANALVHRDYTSGGRVLVRVFDDRLVVSSPGILPEGVTLQDLTRDPHFSVLRNPRLAEALFYAEIIERWGSGTTRMARECEAAGLPAPEFEIVGQELWVTFRKDPFTDERLKAMGLSDRQILVVRVVQKKRKITNAELQTEASVSARTATRDLTDLVARGVLQQKGGVGKGTHYELSKNFIGQTRHEHDT